MYITGSYDSKTAIENGDICLSINSVGTLDGKKVYGDNEPEKMKELLDLSNARPIEINYKVIVNDDAPEDFCNQPLSVTGEPEAQIHYISNPSKVGNGYY